jgi:hypothetical protein
MDEIENFIKKYLIQGLVRPYPPLDILSQVAHAVIPVSDLDNHEVDPGLAVFVFLLDGSGNRGLGFQFIVDVGIDVKDIHRTDAFDLGFTYNPMFHPQQFVDQNGLSQKMPEGFTAADTQFTDVPGVKVYSFLMHIRSIHETQLAFCYFAVFYNCHVSPPRNAGGETDVGEQAETPLGSPAKTGSWSKTGNYTFRGGSDDTERYNFKSRENSSINIHPVPMKIYSFENNTEIHVGAR